MAAMNRAFIRGDFVEALHQIDVLDAAVGGDAFLDATRASILVRRNGPGDLEDAATRAERAVQAEPKLAMTHGVTLAVATARRQWSSAISTLNILEHNFGTTLSEELSDGKFRGPATGTGFASPKLCGCARTRST